MNPAPGVELSLMMQISPVFPFVYRSDDEEPVRPGLKQRLFCDICDVFDAHDTDDCPTQSSGVLDDQGTQYHGNRNEERPYCDICESRNKSEFYLVKILQSLSK